MNRLKLILAMATVAASATMTAQDIDTSGLLQDTDEATVQEIPESGLVIVNAHFEDADDDGIISYGEKCKVIFEVMNRGSQVVTNIKPVVAEAEANKHIRFSPSKLIDQIRPGKGIRYTCTVKADNKLATGMATLRIYVVQGTDAITPYHDIEVPTKGKK